MKIILESFLSRICILILFMVIVLRVLSIGFYPVFDTTEARYGEMARIMFELGNWVTPSFDYNTPFLGKPPLFIWLSVISAKLFGFSEFSIRFPSIVTTIITLFFVWKLSCFHLGKNSAWLTITIIVTTTITALLSGAIIAEPSLLLSISLIFAGFWIGLHSRVKKQALAWQYIFFVGCGIAMIAKGPVVCFLGLAPIFIWALYTKQVKKIWHKFPWLTGSIISLAISLPWYIIAEIKNPGFLKYFIIGEHFNRYLLPNWSGDRYGNAHNQPIGYIWYEWLQGFLPWSIVFITFIVKKIIHSWGENFKKNSQTNINNWQLFLYIAFLTPLLFFSLARNIIWTYAFPAVIPMGLLLSEWITEIINRLKRLPIWILITLSITPILLVGFTTWAMLGKSISPQKQLLTVIHDRHRSLNEVNIIYWEIRPFSARFYSNGKAKLCSDIAKLQFYIAETQNKNYYIIKLNELEKLPDEIQQKFNVVQQSKDWVLLTSQINKSSI